MVCASLWLVRQIQSRSSAETEDSDLGSCKVTTEFQVASGHPLDLTRVSLLYGVTNCETRTLDEMSAPKTGAPAGTKEEHPESIRRGELSSPWRMICYSVLLL